MSEIILSRNQLRQFLPTPEAIKAFENLFLRATIQTPSEVEDIYSIASSAQVLANQAIAQIETLKKDVELLLLRPEQSKTNQSLDYIQLYNTFSKIKKDGLLYREYPLGDLSFVNTNGLIQKIGFDTLINAHNNSGVTIAKGSSVGYAGAIGGTILCQKFLADGATPTQYILGVAAEDIADGADGHILSNGYILGINATGSLYGETWSNGDILYAHPSTQGGLTKIKPTAPKNVIPMAVVLDSSLAGSIYIRVSIEQQLYYGAFYDTTNQTIATINTAYPILFGSTSSQNGISIGTPASRIVVAKSGMYSFSFSSQLTSGSASAKDVWFWARKNGVDVPSSSMKTTITGAGVTLATSRSMFFSLNAGDYIECYWASSDTNVTLEAVPSTAFAPATPSVILSVEQIMQ